MSDNQVWRQQKCYGEQMKGKLPHQTDQRFLIFAATGTDLIFNRGVELPGFASFALVEDPKAQPIIVDQLLDLMNVAADAGLGCIIDTLTWMANLDRAAPLGYDTERLAALNRKAVELMCELRGETSRDDVLVELCIGTSRDAYAKLEPISVSFVVESDGCLDNGIDLEDAIDQVDVLTDRAPADFMVNCAHPDHFSNVLTGHPRLKGMAVNASRCSHAELDNATELDDGDPKELGRDIARLIQEFPAFTVVGGCCGSDFRHMREMAAAIST